MTVRYECNGGCGRLLSEVDDRLELSIVEAKPLAPGHDDEDEDRGQIVNIEIPDLFPSATHHFCSPGCLGAWAMDRAIDESNA